MVNSNNANGTPGAGQLLRPRYFPRQVVTAADLTADQQYLIQRLKRHNRYLHGCGVVCGLEVLPNPELEGGFSVTVTAGYALSPQGDEIYVPNQQTVMLDCVEDPRGDCTNLEAVPAGQYAYLAVRYIERDVQPVPALPERCAPVTTCEYSRFQAYYEIKCFTELPEGCQGREIDCNSVCELLQGQRIPPPSLDDIPALFSCPPETSGPWVLLAGLEVTEGGLTVDYTLRSQVISSWQIMEVLRCGSHTGGMRFQVYTDVAGEGRWRLLNANGQIVADSGEGYATREETRADLQQVQTEAAKAAIEDLTAPGATPSPTRAETRFQVYIDQADEYRWRMLAGHEEIIADSGEGYATRLELDRDLYLIRTQVWCAGVEELAEPPVTTTPVVTTISPATTPPVVTPPVVTITPPVVTLPTVPGGPVPPGGEPVVVFRAEDFPGRVVTEVNGIGPTFEGRLEAGGITNLAGLASMEPGALADMIGVSEVRAMSFINQARDLLQGQ